MKRDNAYYPDALATNKYLQYSRYLYEYLLYKDYSSIASSFRFVTKGIPEKRRRVAKSALGKFYIRKGTTDFQFINYAYERGIRNYLKKNLHSFKAFVDIGACIGEYCIWLASKGKSCYAFEPVPANFNGLMENIKLNKLNDQVHAFNCGLGRQNEQVFFEVMETVTGSSHIDREKLSQNTLPIQICKLDEILTPEKVADQMPTIVKMDVEGMELEVLEGSKFFLQRMEDLRIIYEHSFSGAEQIKKLLLDRGDFKFLPLDKYNTMAFKS